MSTAKVPFSARSGDLTPMSTAQEAIWLEQLRYPEQVNAGFFLVVLRGAAAEPAIRAACSAVCAATPELRGLVVDREGRFWIAVCAPDEVFQFETVTLSCPDGAELEAAARWYLASRPAAWDLTAQPPIRFYLLQHRAGCRTLVIAVHHIAFDGRSKFVFARRFTAALAATIRGEKPRAEPAPVLAPRVEPQADDSIDRGLAAACALWGEIDLAAYPGMVLPQPDRPGAPTGVGATARFAVGVNTCLALAEVAREAGGSFFSGLLAVTAAHLGRYGNEKLVVCIPADISTPATRDRIGMQVNTVPCLLAPRPAATFRELTVETASVLRDVDRFRRVPFHSLVRELRRAYGADVGSGVFDRLGVSYPRFESDLGEVPGVLLKWDFFAPNSTRSFQGTLQVRRNGDRTFGRLDYSTALFDAPAAESFVADWQDALLRLVASPDAPIGQVARTRALKGLRSQAVPADARIRRWDELRDLHDGSGTVLCAVEQFLPTEDMLSLVRAGIRIILVLKDSDGMVLAWGAWTPDLDSIGEAPALAYSVAGWVPDIRTADGRRAPSRTPGVLADRPWIRTRMDGRGRLRYLGMTEQAVAFCGRPFDGAAAERRVAALPGVGEAAVTVWQDGGRLVAGVIVVLAREAASGATGWRRRVWAVWSESAAPSPKVLIAGGLPRDQDGAVDRHGVRAMFRG